MNPDSIEILTIEEFIERLKIGRTTFFDWKKKGKLKAGRDFIQNGRIIRILWCTELLNRLLEGSSGPESKAASKRSRQEQKTVRPPQYKTAINFDY